MKRVYIFYEKKKEDKLWRPKKPFCINKKKGKKEKKKTT